jgi:hypothetical protein
MLLLLIPVVWLAVFVLCVAICRMAALGDARPAPRAPRSSPHPDIVIDRLVVWEELSEVALPDTMPGDRIRGRRLAARGIPHHGIR